MNKYASRKFALAIVSLSLIAVLGFFDIGIQYVSLVPVIYTAYVSSNVMQHNSENKYKEAE